MKPLSYRTIIIIGFILVLMGFVLPFLMIIHVIESTLFLNFFSFVASMVGVFLGLIGAAMYVENYRHRR